MTKTGRNIILHHAFTLISVIECLMFMNHFTSILVNFLNFQLVISSRINTVNSLKESYRALIILAAYLLARKLHEMKQARYGGSVLVT